MRQLFIDYLIFLVDGRKKKANVCRPYGGAEWAFCIIYQINHHRLSTARATVAMKISFGLGSHMTPYAFDRRDNDNDGQLEEGKRMKMAENTRTVFKPRYVKKKIIRQKFSVVMTSAWTHNGHSVSLSFNTCSGVFLSPYV